MMKFAMTHPWLFFWLVVVALCLLDNMVGNICTAIMRRKGEK